MKRPSALFLVVLVMVTALMSLHITRVSAKAPPPVDSLHIVDATDFLERYRTLNGAQNSEFYDLYSDRAVIHAQVIGQARGVIFQGRSYKQWARDLLERGRFGLDNSVFREATVEQRGARLVLRAKRYSLAHCYWDTAYQVGIEKEGSEYRILEERFAFNPSAHCDRNARAGWADGGVDGTVSGDSPASLGYGAVSNHAPGGGYHPLTQQEIADAAWRLAQQLTASQSATRSGSLPADMLSQSTPGTGPRLPAVGASAAAPASTLWRTPED